MPTDQIEEDGQHFNEGRPCLQTARDKHILIRSMLKLRADVGCFNVRCLQVEAGTDPEMSDDTVRRCVNSEDYKYSRLVKKV